MKRAQKQQNKKQPNPAAPGNHPVPLLSLNIPRPGGLGLIPSHPIHHMQATNPHYMYQFPPPPQLPPPPMQMIVQNQKTCSLCPHEPKFTCGRCGAYYCSETCQKKDWLQHRFICFAMPPLVRMKGSSRSEPPIAPLPQNKSQVIITGFRRPDLFYVRDFENNAVFLKDLEKIRTYGSQSEPMTDSPSPNTYAMVSFNGLRRWAKILSASSPDSIRVLCIDEGFTLPAHLKDLYHLPDKVINILQHAVAIKLKDVGNYVVNDKMNSYLMLFCEKSFRLVYAHESDENQEFYLETMDSKSSVNSMITSFAETCTNLYKYKSRSNSKSLPSDNSDHSITEAPFEVEKFELHQTYFEVIILNTDFIEYGIFSCIAKEKRKDLDEVRTYLEKYTPTPNPYSPQIGEYCLASVKGKWIRVQVTKIDKQICKVDDIDTKQYLTVPKENIRRYPDDFKVPCATVLCKITGLNPINGNVQIKKLLESKIRVNSEHIINKIRNIDSMTHVQMDDLIDDMISDFQSGSDSD